MFSPDDIEIRFFELGECGNEVWSEVGSFSAKDVHRQVSIISHLYLLHNYRVVNCLLNYNTWERE